MHRDDPCARSDLRSARVPVQTRARLRSKCVRRVRAHFLSQKLVFIVRLKLQFCLDSEADSDSAAPGA